MATRTTVLRNTGVFTQAQEQGKRVRFTYTDGKTGATKRRTVKPLSAEKTRHNPDALIVRAVEGPNNFRSFRTDRVMRAVIV